MPNRLRQFSQNVAFGRPGAAKNIHVEMGVYGFRAVESLIQIFHCTLDAEFRAVFHIGMKQAPSPT